MSDIYCFQEAIDSLTDWARVWQMPISISKCFTLDFTYSNNDVYYNNNIDGIEITDVNGARDLGVYVDNLLSFVKHIACIVSKAKLRTAQLFKCFTTHK